MGAFFTIAIINGAIFMQQYFFPKTKYFTLFITNSILWWLKWEYWNDKRIDFQILLIVLSEKETHEMNLYILLNFLIFSFYNQNNKQF